MSVADPDDVARGEEDEFVRSTTKLTPSAFNAYIEQIAAMAAQYAFAIGCNQLFNDGNKRTAMVVYRTFLILNGQIGSVFGVPVIVSEHMRENLNASGVCPGNLDQLQYSP